MLEQKLDKISQENQNQVVNIKISDVYPNGDQPRIYFDEDKIIALCESIKKHGVLQPIVVRPDDEGRYMIIAGERRFRASIMANKESIPAIIKDMPIKEVLEIALVENLQRENLNIIEEAKAYKNLIDKHKSTQEELAELVGRSRPYITNTMRLLNLSDEVKKYIELEKISPGHGKALLRVSNKEKQIGLAQQIIKENLSVRKTEEIIKGMLEEKKIKNRYVSSVNIKRKGVNTLVIGITEEAPVYYIDNGSKLEIINENLNVLEEVDSIEGRNLVEVKGIDLSRVNDESYADDIHTYKSILANFYPFISENKEQIHLSSLDISNIVNIIGYIGDVKIFFGDDSDLYNKMENVYRIILSENINIKKGYINVSIKGSPVIKNEPVDESKPKNEAET